jgi:CP family cyanate transporter-like MFS transporter
MGIFAPVAGYLGALLGTRRAMTIALALIGAFGVLRAVVPSIWLVLLLTFPVGMGMGLGNALAPLVVRETVPDRPATGTGVYTTGIQLGSTLAAALAVPLAALLGGWRWALIALALSACVVTIAWVVLERDGEAHERPSRLMPRLPWRSRTAWLLVGIFGSMASAYYGLNAWLPDAYGERGWSDESAGILLAAMNLTAIPASFLVPWLSDHHGGRRPWLTVMSLCFVTGGVGLVALPAAGYLWALLAGISQGGMFALVMTLPLDLEERQDRVAALVGLMLGVGYTIGAISPFVLGGVRDVTGSFDAVLWVCAGFLALLVVLVQLLPRRATAAGARA